MLEHRIRTLINEGEGLRVEFKTCKHDLNRDVYETVCGFLNRYGGEILLGVNDKGGSLALTLAPSPGSKRIL